MRDSKCNPLCIDECEQRIEVRGEQFSLVVPQNQNYEESISSILCSSIKNLERIRSTINTHHVVSRHDMVSSLTNAEIMIRYVRQMVERKESASGDEKGGM